MPQKAQVSNRKPASKRRPVDKLSSLYLVRQPEVEPVLRVWINPQNTDDILTFATMFGQGNVKLLPFPEKGLIALESGCEYRLNPRIPVGYVYVSSSDAGEEDMQADFNPPVEDLFEL